jgi:hypothetical protein
MATLIKVFLVLQAPWHGQCTASTVLAALRLLFSTAMIYYKDQCCKSATNFISTILKDWNFNLFDNSPVFYIRMLLGCETAWGWREEDRNMSECLWIVCESVRFSIVYLLVLSVELFITAHTRIWILTRLQIVTRFAQCLTGTINRSHHMLQGCSIRFFRTKITSEVITLLNAARWFHWSIVIFQRPPGTIMHFAQAGKRLKIRLWSDPVSYILNHAPTVISTLPFLCNRRPPPAASAAEQMTAHQGKVRNVGSMRDFTLPPRSG